MAPVNAVASEMVKHVSTLGVFSKMETCKVICVRACMVMVIKAICLEGNIRHSLIDQSALLPVETDTISH